MKKMLLATALAPFITDVLNRRLLFKTNWQASITKVNYHPSFLRFLELGRRKLSMQPKFVAVKKMLLKQKPSKHS